MIRPLFALAATTALFAQQPAPTVPAPAPAAAPAEQALQVPEPGRFKQLFQPFRTDTAALSPGGKYLAYSVREKDALAVAVVEIANPGKMTAFIKVVTDEAATPMMAEFQREKTPGRINWLGWVSPTRLVIETNQVYSKTTGGGTWQSWPGTVFAVNADGSDARKLIDASDVEETFIEGDGAGGPSPFSTRRTTTFLQGTPDTTPSEEGTTAASESLTGEAPDPEAVPAASFSGGTSTPRSLRLFGLDPSRPGAVTVVASGGVRDTGSRLLGFYTLDAGTGKVTNLVDELLAETSTPRIDRQGRLRLSLANTTRFSFPFPYQYLGAKGRDRPKPLDTTTGLTGFSVSPDNYFGTRSIPLGFDENPDILYYASNQGRDTFGIYSLNLATGQRSGLAIEHPNYDLISPPGAGFPDLDVLVFDRHTHQLAGVRYDATFRSTIWLRPELQAVQTGLEKMFPGRGVELLDWDAAANRFLVSTEGPADPGAFYLFDREQGKLMEFVRKAPWIETNHVHTTLPYAFTLPDGTRLSGLITVPQQPRLKPIPMIVICPDVPWQRVRPDFSTEVQALADMGFAVVQFNGRGAWGLGIKQRQAITAGYDLVQVQDILATLSALEQRFAVNAKRVALLGRGHGGFIALRAIQEHPDKFRCAIALDAPVNLGSWLEDQRWTEDDVRPQLTKAWLGDESRLKAAPLTSAPEKVTQPVLLLNYPGLEGQSRTPAYLSVRNFAGAINRRGGTAEFGDLHVDYMRGLPAARAEVFDRLEAFLNTHVYEFKVKLKETQFLP